MTNYQFFSKRGEGSGKWKEGGNDKKYLLLWKIFLNFADENNAYICQ
jgi:hypothetical protein